MILLENKLRKKLLTYSFTHPDESYYVRELANLIGMDAGNLSRELKKFEKEGIYVSHRRGDLKFYSLNKKYPLYKEIKIIIFKTEGVGGQLKEMLNQFKDIVLAFIYGSYTKNKEKRTSDIDLIVIGNINQDKFLEKINNLEKELNREINFTTYTEKEFENERKKSGGFLDMIIKDKILLLKGQLNAGKPE